MPVSPENGVVHLASLHAVDETTQRLVGVLEQAGMTIFACIDQQGAARAAGVTMRPMTLVVFGNPRAGTTRRRLASSRLARRAVRIRSASAVRG